MSREERMSGMKKRAAVGLTVILALFAFAGVAGAAGAPAKVRIGVTQIVEHPALDAARQGFVDGLAKAGYVEGKNVEFDFQNAQGDMSLAQTIARKFATNRMDLILAIATPTAQAAAHATKEIPILITAVTDPASAGLVKSNDKPGTNVTGTSDLNPVAEQLALVKKVAPKAKAVGVVYNAGEQNSVFQVNLVKEAAKKLRLTVVEATVASTTDILQATRAIAGKVDALYVPTDNTVVSGIESLLKVAEEAKLPVIGGEAGTVDRGALITVGVSYYRLGEQTAKMAVQVLKGKKPASMAIQYQKELELVINLKAAEAIGLKLPKDLVDKADRVVK